jgi:riboflavin-specific deaminase-like protein
MSLNQRIESWLDSRKFSFPKKNRPFITLAFAQALDGSITSDQGSSVLLSNHLSNQLTHQLRSLHDGILVGIDTVLTDDPQLTVRDWPGKNPQPVVLDSRLRMPSKAKLCQHPDKSCWIFTTQDTSRFKIRQGTEIFTVNKPVDTALENGMSDFVPLEEAMMLLWRKGMSSLMVEGGARVLTEFIKARLADAIVITIAPTILEGYKAFGDLDIAAKCLSPEICPLYAEQLGSDLILWGDLKYGEIKA